METKTCNLLLIEDEPDLQKLIADLCSERPVRLYTAANGVEGLKVLESVAIDAVFSDYNMPALNGRELIERIRARFPKMPFLIWSGYLTEDKIEDLESMGRIKVIEKPFSRKELNLALDRLIRS